MTLGTQRQKNDPLSIHRRARQRQRCVCLGPRPRAARHVGAHPVGLRNMTDEAEKWLSVVGYEGLYEVSNHGRIRSLDRMIFRNPGGSAPAQWAFYPGKILAACRTKRRGVMVVRLSKEGSAPTRDVHVIVLEAFVGPRPSSLHQACHWDGNPSNNHITNLRWGLKADNDADMERHGTRPRGRKHGCAKLTEEQVKLIRATPKRKGNGLAKSLGVSYGTIYHIRKGDTWSSVE